jgi:hypothetical protein
MVMRTYVWIALTVVFWRARTMELTVQSAPRLAYF